MNPLDVVTVGLKIFDKVLPDPKAKAEAQLELLRLQQSGNLEELKQALSVIISDSQSSDPWTSRARPTFLYVVYILLLWSLPMGVFFVINPDAANRFTAGFGMWLAAIPDSLLALFGTVMTGYVFSRTLEKVKGVAK